MLEKSKGVFLNVVFFLIDMTKRDVDKKRDAYL